MAFLAMPKAASTSVERVLAPHCDIIYSQNPRVKHMRFRKYNRFIVPYLSASGFGPVETTCLFREPTDWLFSWYKYRARENIRSKPQSTADMDFDEFAARYIAQDPLVFDIGRSSNFVSGPDGQPAVDQIFRFDRLDSFGGFLENRFEKKLEFEILNPSPEKPFSISASRRTELEQFLAPEFDIYENARR